MGRVSCFPGVRFEPLRGPNSRIDGLVHMPAGRSPVLRPEPQASAGTCCNEEDEMGRLDSPKPQLAQLNMFMCSPDWIAQKK